MRRSGSRVVEPERSGPDNNYASVSVSPGGAACVGALGGLVLLRDG
jgi:hypothetical protein